LELGSGGLKIVQRPEGKLTMSKLSMLANFVRLSLIVGGIGVLSSCASTSYTYKYPTSSDLHELIMEWDAIERTNAKCPEAYRAQYVKALKELNNAISESERWRSRVEQ